jgi:hypothetical protein
MTLLEAFEAGHVLTIELTGDPASARRITQITTEGDHLLAWDGQDSDPWAVRPPTILRNVRGDGPIWMAGHLTIRETDAAAPQQ